MVRHSSSAAAWPGICPLNLPNLHLWSGTSDTLVTEPWCGSPLVSSLLLPACPLAHLLRPCSLLGLALSTSLLSRSTVHEPAAPSCLGAVKRKKEHESWPWRLRHLPAAKSLAVVLQTRKGDEYRKKNFLKKTQHIHFFKCANFVWKIILWNSLRIILEGVWKNTLYYKIETFTQVLVMLSNSGGMQHDLDFLGESGLHWPPCVVFDKRNWPPYSFKRHCYFFCMCQNRN